MKIIDHNTIKNLNIDYLNYYEWAKETFLNKENSDLPPKISMKQENHIFINVMPSVIKNINAAGVKVVSRYPDRKPSLNSQILLYEANTGKELALLDGNIITAYRTAAVATLAINTLAREDYQTIALIGLGNVAYATFNVLTKTINKNIKVKLMKYKDTAEQFQNKYQSHKNIEFEIVDNYKDLITNSDIIISCVTSTDINFGEDEWFKEGCLVVPVHTLGFQNCDLFFDKFIVDDISHVQNFKYFNQFKETHELSDVLKNNKLGRINDKERIMAYNIGNSIFDIYFAKKIYDLVKDKELNEINLLPPTDKYWI